MSVSLNMLRIFWASGEELMAIEVGELTVAGLFLRRFDD